MEIDTTNHQITSGPMDLQERPLNIRICNDLYDGIVDENDKGKEIAPFSSPSGDTSLSEQEQQAADLRIGSSESDLYDDAVMGLLSLNDAGQDDVFDEDEDGSSSPRDEKSAKTYTNASIGICRSTKIPEAYTDDLTNLGGSGFPLRRTNIRSRFGVYVGNMTWWTTDEDIISASRSIGIEDVKDIKIFECRLNGQSKGYCFITFGSEGSVTKALENFDKIKIQGNIPNVKPDAKASISFFESLVKTRPTASSTSSMESGSGGGGGGNLMGQQRNGQNGQLNGGGTYHRSIHYGPRHPPPMLQSGGFPPQRHYNNRNPGGHGQNRPWGPSSYGPHSANHSFVPGNRMPNGNMHNNMRCMPPLMQNSQSFGQTAPPFEDWGRLPAYQSRTASAHVNPAFLNGAFNETSILQKAIEENLLLPPPVPFNSPNIPNYGGEFGDMVSSPPSRPSLLMGSVTMSPPINMPPFHYPPPQLPSSPYAMSMSSTDEKISYTCSDMTDAEIDELLDRNNSICSLAIKRAVTDAANGEYASAIETLVTALSLIKSSKVAGNKRCLVLVSSLQDTLEGIEHKSYGGRSNSKRSGSVERSRAKSSRHYYGSSSSSSSRHRSRSRSPTDSRSRNDFFRTYYRERERHEETPRDRTSSSRRRSYEERERGYSSSYSSDRVERDPVKPKVSRMSDYK